MKSRLSLVTRRDFTGLPASVGAGTMVLYLFRDERFGGTSFFKPKITEHEITALENDLRRREQATGRSSTMAGSFTRGISTCPG
jgi:hypothetical protein